MNAKTRQKRLAVRPHQIRYNPSGAKPRSAGDVSYSVVEGGIVSEPRPGITAGPGNVDADPMFVDPAGNDYRIVP